MIFPGGVVCCFEGAGRVGIGKCSDEMYIMIYLLTRPLYGSTILRTDNAI